MSYEETATRAALTPGDEQQCRSIPRALSGAADPRLTLSQLLLQSLSDLFSKLLKYLISI